MNKSNRRYYRTIVLGLAAMGALVWVALEQFDIPREDFLELLLGTLVAMLLVIGLAAVIAALWIGLRKLLRERTD